MTLLTITGMYITGKPLKTTAAPTGILSFELTGNLSGSKAIINSWQNEKIIFAGINMGLDFLFLTLYSFTIALSCLLISKKIPEQRRFLKKTGTVIAAAVMVAAILDIVENIALIKLLLGSENESLPLLAKWCAIPKFLIVLSALLYIISGLYRVVRHSQKN